MIGMSHTVNDAHLLRLAAGNRDRWHVVDEHEDYETEETGPNRSMHAPVNEASERLA